MPDPKQVTVHVDDTDTAVISCPSCGLTQRASVAKFRDVKHRIATRCKCGERFQVQLNYRKSFRKVVSLPGEFRTVRPTPSPWKKMTVNDLSRGGLCFEMNERLMVSRKNVVGVKFKLDNAKQTLLEKEVVIRFVSGNRLGGEFKDLAAEERSLVFFFFPE